METRTCTHCGPEEYRLTDPLGNPFSDVPENAFCYNPVFWAVEGGVLDAPAVKYCGFALLPANS